MNPSKITIHSGYELHVNGESTAGCFQESDFTRGYYPIPVQWNGAKAHLRYWKYRKVTPLNHAAMSLITHAGFIIRGSAIVVTSAETWHKFCLPGSENEARDKLKSIQHTFSDRVIYKPAGRHQTHTSICVRNKNDAVAIRMVL